MKYEEMVESAMSALLDDHQYWGNQLELDTLLVLERLSDDRHLADWLDGLTPPYRAILVSHLDISTELDLAELWQQLRDRREELIPFMLVDAVGQGKRISAIIETARYKLSPDDLGRARLGANERRYDRNALMWLLYERDSKNLELVLLLDRIQRKGFARMTLESAPARITERPSPGTFFEQDHLQCLLDAFEERYHTLRQSHCSAVLCEEGRYRVVIKRDDQPSLVSRGEKNTFGFEREWIIFDFTPDLRRVQIGGLSPDVPLRIANHIASSYFNQHVRYENECVATDAEVIIEFLHSLNANPDALPLVELVARNSGLDGSPQLRLNDRCNESLAPALSDFAAVFGNPLAVVTDIESIKVYAFGRRVRLVFEPLGDDAAQFIVRYNDQFLDHRTRRAFEQLMRQDHGISILPIEKKHAD